MKTIKAISTIFSTLIVTFIVLTLSVPLMLYFYHAYSTLNLTQSNEVRNIDISVMTRLSAIELNDTLNGIFIYNYGSIPAHITEVIIDNITYSINFTLEPNQIVPLSAILGNNYNKNTAMELTTDMLILNVNGVIETIYF